jgi:putative oxidoreductase
MVRPSYAAECGFEICRTEAEWRTLLSEAEYLVLREEETERRIPAHSIKKRGWGPINVAAVICLFIALMRNTTAAEDGQVSSKAYPRDRHQRRPKICVSSAHRGALPSLRMPPRPCVRCRAATNRRTLLPKRPQLEFRTRRMTQSYEFVIGRVLLSLLFVAGVMQKALDPLPAQSLLSGGGLPEWLVWPALIFNVLAAALLIAGRFLKPIGRGWHCIALRPAFFTSCRLTRGKCRS